MLIKIFNFITPYLLRVRLVSFFSHYNSIVILENLSKQSFLKISFSKKSRNLIDNEHKGYQWYSKILKKKLYFKLNHNFLKRFEIKKFEGYFVDYQNNIVKNKKKVYQIINYYKNNWPKKKIIPAHGDFTFANLIFGHKKNEIFVIDWENFKKSGEPWGFDLVYFFLSIAILPNIKKTNFSKREKRELLIMWKKIKTQIKDKNLKKNPIQYFQKIFKRKKHWSKLNKIFPTKFFLNKTNKKLLNNLDQLIRKIDLKSQEI